jgi:hypothetical protein
VDFKKKRYQNKLEAQMDVPICLVAAADVDFMAVS